MEPAATLSQKRSVLQCPYCKQDVVVSVERVCCQTCGASFQTVGNICDFIEEGDLNRSAKEWDLYYAKVEPYCPQRDWLRYRTLERYLISFVPPSLLRETIVDF